MTPGHLSRYCPLWMGTSRILFMFSPKGGVIFAKWLTCRVEGPGLLPQSGTSLKSTPGLESLCDWLSSLLYLHQSSTPSVQSASFLSVVDRIMNGFPQVSNPTSQNSWMCCLTWQKEFAGVLKLEMWRWRDYPWWTKCHHKGPSKRESGYQRREKMLCCWFWRWRKGPQLKEWRWPLGDESVRKGDSPPELQKEGSLADWF